MQTLNGPFEPRKRVPEGVVQDLTIESVFTLFTDGFDMAFLTFREALGVVRLSVERRMRAAAEAAAAAAVATSTATSAQNSGGQAAP